MELYARISNVSDFIVLVPILLLPLGAIFIALVTPKISKSAQRWLPIALLTLETIVILLNIAPSSHRFELSTWDLASFSIVFQLDGVALVLLLAIFVPLIALQLVTSRTLDAFAIYVLASATTLICAGNLITIFFAWAFLDFALFAWREARGIAHDIAMRALVLGQLASLVLFTGAILLGAKQSETGAMLIALAFWARLGLFPFHWISPNADVGTFELASIRGATIVAGASLWLRWDGMKISAPSDLIGSVAAMAFIAATIWITREGEAVEKIAVNASAAAIAVPLAIVFGGEAALAFALWVALGIAFAFATFELGIAWQSDYQSRWARLYFVAGIASLAGFPLTPAFLGKVGAFIALAEKGQGVLLILILLAMTFLLAPLWRIGIALRGSEPREPTRGEYAGLQFLGITFIVVAFSPIVILQAIGQTASDSSNQALITVIRTNDVIGVGIGFIVLLAPMAISFLLARVDWGYHPQWDDLIRFASRVIDLDWLGGLLAGTGEKLSRLAVNLSALAEENPTVWILFVGLWIAIFILTSR